MISDEEIEKLKNNPSITLRDIKAIIARNKSPHDELKEMRERHIKEQQEYIKKYNLDFRRHDRPRNYGSKSKSQRIEEIRLNQANLCAICSNEFKSTKDMHYDHCHDTKKYRGLLCHNCNIGLGNFKDNIGKLKNAVDYLLYWRDVHS